MTEGCTCHWLDIGPRCAACVEACTAAGHPYTEAKTNGIHCKCGTPPPAGHMRCDMNEIPDAALVEKAAMFVHIARCKHCTNPDPVQRRDAAVALAAVLPDVRRIVAEEIAAAIGGEREKVESMRGWHDGCRAGLAKAARIARDAGATP